MFFNGFEKTATATSGISPEEYYELETDKYPHAGANIGAITGAVIGAHKGAKGKKQKGALIGAALGGITGAAAGHVAGKVVKHYKVNRLHNAIHELNLRSTPHYNRHSEE